MAEYRSTSLAQRMRERAARAGSAEQQLVANEKAELLQQMDQIAAEAERIREIAHAFERWHQDMISLLDHSKAMHGKGDDLGSIVRQLIMLSLNAAIEAARAGDSARGFVVVAAEVRSLAVKAQELSADLGKVLHKSDLSTTATFQDIQAGGKMMMAAISGLDSRVRRLREKIESP